MRFSVLSGAALAVAAMAAPAVPEIEVESRAVDAHHSSQAMTMPIEWALEMIANSTDTEEEETFSTQAVAAARCSNPTKRVEWRNLSTAQKNEFIRAAKCLWNKAPGTLSGGVAKTRHETLAWVHQQMAGSIHQSGIFLPWHRYYLHTYAKLLRSECSFTGPFPWWDETKDAGNFAGNTALFNAQYFGTLPVNADGGVCASNGAFSGRQLHIGYGSGSSAHCLARGEDTSASSQVNQNYFNACVAQTNYANARKCIELGPHGYGHNAIGRVMSDVAASPSDPIFFMHHAYIDRLWKKWQNGNSNRWTSISGCSTPTGCTPLTMNTVLSSMGLRPDETVADVLDTQNENLCYIYDY